MFPFFSVERAVVHFFFLIINPVNVSRYRVVFSGTIVCAMLSYQSGRMKEAKVILIILLNHFWELVLEFENSFIQFPKLHLL